ncbi:MAG: hypothetical protein R3F11_08860 [Verrucomicrobiales bacterium]
MTVARRHGEGVGAGAASSSRLTAALRSSAIRHLPSAWSRRSRFGWASASACSAGAREEARADQGDRRIRHPRPVGGGRRIAISAEVWRALWSLTFDSPLVAEPRRSDGSPLVAFTVLPSAGLAYFVSVAAAAAPDRWRWHQGCPA